MAINNDEDTMSSWLEAIRQLPPPREVLMVVTVTVQREPRRDIYLLTFDGNDQLKYVYQPPKTIKDGDYTVVGNMGAYSNACATQFNGIPEAEFVRVTSL